MTCGMCPLVLAFLTKAAKQRKFHVFVAECAPKYDVRRSFIFCIIQSDMQSTQHYCRDFLMWMSWIHRFFIFFLFISTHLYLYRVIQWQKLYVLLGFKRHWFKTLQCFPSCHVSTRSSLAPGRSWATEASRPLLVLPLSLQQQSFILFL